MPFSVEDELQTVASSARHASIVARIDEVRRVQAANGMEPRDDSRLTWRFATGELDPYLTAVDVAKELVWVDHFHRHTSYRRLTEEVMRYFANQTHFKYGVGWNEAWRITREYVPEMIKIHCLQHISLPSVTA